MSKGQQPGSTKLPYHSIETAWQFFKSKVIQRDAPAIQIEEMRKAFYVGASSCFDLLYCAPTWETEEQGIARMESIHKEFTVFAGSLLPLRAPKAMKNVDDKGSDKCN